MSKNGYLAIIDYGTGNLSNILKLCQYVGFNVKITDCENEILEADAIILPGVGAFGDAMGNLMSKGLDTVVEQSLKLEKPLLGICLGYQLLMESSSEFGFHKGLGVFRGRVRSFSECETYNELIKIPQVGWNSVVFSERDDICALTMMRDIENSTKFYFANSFVVTSENDEWVLGKTNYNGIAFDSIIQHEKTIGVQFHPEMSGAAGIKFMKNFYTLTYGEES